MTVAPRTPQEVIELFAERLNRGDVDGALDLYEPEATFAVEPGRTVQGPDAIRQALGSFVALEPTLSGTIEKTLCAGDVALVINRWTLEGSQPDGQPVRMAGLSADVLRRDPGGAWRIAIDDPWGGEAA
jgi:ketosteroid isomerase-like protein